MYRCICWIAKHIWLNYDSDTWRNTQVDEYPADSSENKAQRKVSVGELVVKLSAAMWRILS
jgi:hypothetical protein